MSIEIPLTKGETAIVSDIDKDLAQWSWSLSDSNRKRLGSHYTCYAKCWINHTHASVSPYKVGQTKRLHRVIMERIVGRALTRKEHTDHINGNGLDNRRENLRLVSNSQNSMNSKKPKARGSSSYGKYSKYKGVSRYKKRNGELGAYFAHIRKDGKIKYIRGCDSEEAAARAYDKAAKELFGEYAYLNFPDEKNP